MTELLTALGPRSAEELGAILPHEHIVSAVWPPGERPSDEVEPPDIEPDDLDLDAVVARVAPAIEGLRAAGVTALVDATALDVGRRVAAIAAVARATDFPIAFATGLFHEPSIPAWAHEATETRLTDWMLGELTDQVGATGLRAAWIKVSAGDEVWSETERKVLRAAATASRHTGCAIGSHTTRGTLVAAQLDALEGAGVAAERFIWIHTQTEPDPRLHLEIARRGAWIEYDHIGLRASDDEDLALVLAMIEAGRTTQLLLSHDRGAFDLRGPVGEPVDFTYLFDTFVPRMLTAGVGPEVIATITRDNPFAAYAR